MAVAPVHTAPGVLLGGVKNLIGLGLDTLILRYVLRPPAPCLRQARQDKDQLHAGAALPQTDHRLGGEGIKAQGASRLVCPDALLVQTDDDTFQSVGNPGPFLWRYFSMAGKAAGYLPHSLFLL